MGSARRCTYPGAPVTEGTDVDLLAWFAEDERQRCPLCGRHACVGLPEARAGFCPACGAVAIDGLRIESRGRLPL